MIRKFIGIAILAITLGLTAKSQNTEVRMNSEQVGFFTLTDTTMYITKKDNIVIGSIKPVTTGDSCTITGKYMSVGGIVSNGITVTTATSINWGFNYAISDSITLVCYGKNWVILLKNDK
jgi:hypothetical protein